MMRNIHRHFAFVVAALVSNACDNTTTPPPEPQLFDRYVAIGGSVAAGVQSSGISAQTQAQAYPALLAALFTADFVSRSVTSPGCPAPGTAPLQVPGSETPCTLAALAPLDGRGQNIAVPHARAADAVTQPPASRVPHHQVLLGQRTQVGIMSANDPTAVTVHLGDHDVWDAAISGTLGPATTGADSTLTRVSTFQNAYGGVVAAVNSENTIIEAALIAILDPVTFLPHLQPGSYYFLTRDATGRFNGKLVNSNCSPVNALGQPNPLAANLVSLSIMHDSTVGEINCDPAAFPVGDARRGKYLLDTAEQAIVRARVTALNDIIRQHAQTNGWEYVDPNLLLQGRLTQTDAQGRFMQIRKCQNLAAATTAAQMQTAVLVSCPVTGATGAPNFFGAVFSFDGVHPSAEFHSALAAEVSAALQ